MRLSPTMRSHLVWCWQVLHCGPRGASIVRLMRPGHYENLATHNALLRRGLLRETGRQRVYTSFTRKGAIVARRLIRDGVSGND